MGAKLGQKLPHMWKTGPCERTHKQYVVFAQQKNQANWRNEDWQLTFQEWQTVWEPKWDTGRGRSGDCYCLVTRSEHVSKQSKKLDKQKGSQWRLRKKQSEQAVENWQES